MVLSEDEIAYEKRKAHRLVVKEMLERHSSLSHDEEETFINALVEIDINDGRYCRAQILEKIKLNMPATFASKADYLAKLEEQLDKEAEADRLSAEIIGKKGIKFKYQS